ATPEIPTAMGVADGPGVETRVHIRGSHLSLGPTVPRHVPTAVAGPTPPAFSPGTSGRLELARWIASPDHPLTARVMVNRVWRWHFGRGIVASADNFGKLGETPSHPELLDWLARRFAADGWSIKGLHRLILSSRAYQMSSRAEPSAMAADPDNRKLGRFPVRRLEAEAIRDAMLAASGQLDRTMGGSLLSVKNRAYFFDHTSRDATKYDSPRRSLYLPVVRNNVYEVFQLFDFPDPGVSNGDRAATTVAPQSLFLMNGELALASAAGLADRALGLSDLDDAGKVATLYRIAYGRPPTGAETARALEALARLGATLDGPRAAWQALAQALIASNEFLYLR
ncbi:MAG: DUF1553 domain-containing protein, partial [Thermoleophilia bacterium]|nr:DUF1553 domain-containing protein [Thermoleophilia bacterium]